MMTLSQYLRREGLTQAQFAARLGVTQATVSRLATGGRPSWALAVKIDEATDGNVGLSVWAEDAKREPESGAAVAGR